MGRSQTFPQNSRQPARLTVFLMCQRNRGKLFKFFRPRAKEDITSTTELPALAWEIGRYRDSIWRDTLVSPRLYGIPQCLPSQVATFPRGAEICLEELEALPNDGRMAILAISLFTELAQTEEQETEGTKYSGVKI